MQNNISINLYVVESKNSIQPLLTCSQNEKMSNHVNLLLIEEEDKSHYGYIKSVTKLVSNQLTKHEKRQFIWKRCFYHTEKAEIYRRHRDLYDHHFTNEKAISILPNEKNKILKFKNMHKTIPVPLVYYADL